MQTAVAPMTSRGLIARLENYYDFACEGGPLKNCVEWQQLKDAIASVSKLQAWSVRMRQVCNGVVTERLNAKLVGLVDELDAILSKEVYEALIAYADETLAPAGAAQTEIARLTAERDETQKELHHWRTRRLHGGCEEDRLAEVARTAEAVQRADAAETERDRLRKALEPVVIEMDGYAQHETLYRDMAVGRQVSEWAEQLRAALQPAEEEKR